MRFRLSWRRMPSFGPSAAIVAATLSRGCEVDAGHLDYFQAGGRKSFRLCCCYAVYEQVVQQTILCVYDLGREQTSGAFAVGTQHTHIVRPANMGGAAP